jgi:hypothetical protein
LSDQKEKYLVIEGDFGGVINLVAPASMVKCDQDTLQQLAYDLEVQGGGSEEDAKAGSYHVDFYLLSLGERIRITTGDYWSDGFATEGLWLLKFAEHLRPYVEVVLAGKAKSIEDARRTVSS